jgi:uncharacterized protein YkvS
MKHGFVNCYGVLLADVIRVSNHGSVCLSIVTTMNVPHGVTEWWREGLGGVVEQVNEIQCIAGITETKSDWMTD